MSGTPFLTRINNFKIRYLSGHRFLYLLAALVGLGVGLAATIIKNLVEKENTVIETQPIVKTKKRKSAFAHK